MEPKNRTKTQWWRYPVAAVVFVLVVELAPLIIGLVWTLLDLITPRMYRSGLAWTCVLAYSISGVIASGVAISFTNNPIFAAVISGLWAAWMAYYSISGFSAGYIMFEAACGMWVETVILIAVVVIFTLVAIKKKNKEKRNDKPDKSDKINIF